MVSARLTTIPSVLSRTTHPHGILPPSFDIEHRVVGEGEQARAIGGVFRIGGDAEACLDMYLQTSVGQKDRLAQCPPNLFGLVQRLSLVHARENDYELVAPVTYAKSRRAHTLPDHRSDLLEGLAAVEMPIRVHDPFEIVDI